MRATHGHDRKHSFARGVALAAGAIALLAAVGFPQLASAASKTVQVGDNVYTLPGVAVQPGDTVTWEYPVGAGEDHHNVHFEDRPFINPNVPTDAPWTTSPHAFDTAGEYRYFCDEHGGFGGQGMSGIVYVNETGTMPGIAPTASFTLSKTTAALGDVVTLNASASSDPEGGALEYEWDLDGNGTLETNTGSIPTTSTPYVTSGTRNIKLRVTDPQHHMNETTRMLVVSAAPTASFTAPSSAQTGQTVAFNASASGDTDGTIAKYEWDLDGDGVYETDTGTTATTTRSYATVGARTIRLRVTDNAGLTTVTTRSIQISAPPPPVAKPVIPVVPAPAAPAPVSCSSLTGAKRTACVQKTTCAKLKGSKRASCIQKSCRYVKGTSRAKCVLKSCRYLKRKSQRACKLKSCRYLKGSKKKACVRKYRRR
jgi:plastocyanin